MDATTVVSKHKMVTVTLGVTREDGQPTTVEKTIESGPTLVPALKQELEVPADSSLWVIVKGKKKPLADHQHHDVKAGDHFEALVKGGVS
jgi:hypothetical protein